MLGDRVDLTTAPSASWLSCDIEARSSREGHGDQWDQSKLWPLAWLRATLVGENRRQRQAGALCGNGVAGPLDRSALYASLIVRGGEARSSKRIGASLLMLGFALLLVAWIMATQPFAAPDEASHYLRALSITNGQILGPKVRYPLVPGLTPTQMAWLQRDTRAVTVPARLSPPNVNCIDGKPDISGRCLEATPNGNFPPLGYFLPAVALSASNDASSGIWLSRVASALPSLAFLLLTVALLWSTTGWSLLGLLAATTPMVLFASSVMNSSGIEITACLAFAASVLRVTRSPAGARRWVWAAFALAGAVAILSWPLGLVFVIGDLALFGVLLGRRGLRELRRGSGRQLRLSALALLVAAVLSLIYSRLSGLGAAKLSISPIWRSLHEGLDQLSPVLHDSVGSFASLTVHLPPAAYWIWWLLVVGLFVAALGLGEGRERLVLVAVVVLALAFPVVFYAWFDRLTGFGLQGREVLPALTLIPLMAGEVIYRRRSAITQRRSAQVMLSGAIALIAMFQAYAWWFNARAAAGAPHTIRFYAHAIWSPPLGWLPWIAVAGFGTAALLTFAANEALGRPLALEQPTAPRHKLEVPWS